MATLMMVGRRLLLSFLVQIVLSLNASLAWRHLSPSLKDPHLRTTRSLFHLRADSRQEASDESMSESSSKSLQRALQDAEEAAFLRFRDSKAPKWASSLQAFPFECTSCGKCCKTQGSVYLSPDDAKHASQALGVTVGEFVSSFASHTLSMTDDSKWIRLREREDACIFLNETTNQCEIYHARPSQCRTYPFWPSILISRETWNSECRRPETTIGQDGTEGLVDLPMWTPESGGCEGMRPVGSRDATVVPGIIEESAKASVPRDEALRALFDYTVDSRRFPSLATDIPVEHDA